MAATSSVRPAGRSLHGGIGEPPAGVRRAACSSTPSYGRAGAKSQYNGWLDCVKTSWARGGARTCGAACSSAWRGRPINAARIGSFDFFKVLLADFPPIFAGFCSGALGGCVADPVEVLKAGHAGRPRGPPTSQVGRGPHYHVTARRARGGRADARDDGPRHVHRGMLGPGTHCLPLRAQAALLTMVSRARLPTLLLGGVRRASIFFCNSWNAVPITIVQSAPRKARYSTPATRSPKSSQRGPLASTRAHSATTRLGPHHTGVPRAGCLGLSSRSVFDFAARRRRRAPPRSPRRVEREIAAARPDDGPSWGRRCSAPAPPPAEEAALRCHWYSAGRRAADRRRRAELAGRPAPRNIGRRALFHPAFNIGRSDFLP